MFSRQLFNWIDYNEDLTNIFFVCLAAENGSCRVPLFPSLQYTITTLVHVMISADTVDSGYNSVQGYKPLSRY